MNILEEAKSTGCILCRSINRIHFHHVNPSDKVFDIGSLVNYLHLGIPEGLEEELEKCVVLCARCHGKVHGRGPARNWIIDKELYYLLQYAASPDRR